MSQQEQTLELCEPYPSVRVTRVNDDVARVYFVSPTGDPLAAPDDCHLYNCATERYMPLYYGEWLISWVSNYHLIGGDPVLLRIENPRNLFLYNRTMHVLSP